MERRSSPPEEKTVGKKNVLDKTPKATPGRKRKGGKERKGSLRKSKKKNGWQKENYADGISISYQQQLWACLLGISRALLFRHTTTGVDKICKEDHVWIYVLFLGFRKFAKLHYLRKYIYIYKTFLVVYFTLPLKFSGCKSKKKLEMIKKNSYLVACCQGFKAR